MGAIINNIFTKNKLVKNFTFLFSSMVVTTVCQFVCFAILGNKMAVDDYGQFNTMIALASTVSVFVNNILAGIVANRELALDPTLSRVLLKKFTFVRLIAFAIGAISLSVYVSAKNTSSAIMLIGVVAMLFADAFWDLFEQVAFGMKITRYSMMLNILSSLIWVIVVLLIPAQLMSAATVLLLYGLIMVLRSLGYGVIDVKITATYKDVKTDIPYKYLVANSMPYMYNRVFGIVSTQLPILLLDGYAGLSETAYYAVGEKFTTPISKITMVVVSAVFPFLTSALKKKREVAKITVVSLFQVILSVGACVSLFLSATSNVWLVALFGEKYTSAVEAFNYQIWFTIALSVDSLFSMLLSSDYKQKTLSVITTIDALLLIPFLFFGIQYGAKGLAMAKLTHAVFCLLYHLLIISKCFSDQLINGKLIMSWVFFVALICASIFISDRAPLLCINGITLMVIMMLNIPAFKNIIAVMRKPKKKL